jgi:hypothetical protein
MTSFTSSRAALALALTVAVSASAAACGGSPNPAPEVAPPPPAETAAAPAPTPPATASAVAAPPPAPAPPAGPAGTPVQASALLAEVKKVGIDPAKMPVLEKMSLADKKKVMPFFVKALGYKDCTGCHASLSDYATVTHNMELTRGMWDHFVAYGRDASDGLMFCDSCHAGSARILNRADKEGAKAFMKSDYAGKIHRADKKPMDCKTCHGDPFQTDIFGQVWHVK